MSKTFSHVMTLLSICLTAVCVSVFVHYFVKGVQASVVPVQEWNVNRSCPSIHITETYITRYGVRNDLATKAFRISNGDMDFLKTIEYESEFDPNNTKGDDGLARGLCQWRPEWHSDIINDPRFRDPDWQLQKCFEFYSGYIAQGIITKRLYGFNQRHTKDHTFKVLTYENEIKMYNCK